MPDHGHAGMMPSGSHVIAETLFEEAYGRAANGIMIQSVQPYSRCGFKQVDTKGTVSANHVQAALTTDELSHK